MTFITNPALLPKVRSRALLAACQDMPCTLRVASFIPGQQCAHQTTVVPCHIDATLGKGMGTKVSDLFVAAGCFHCHNIIDGRDPKGRAFIMDNYPTAFMERLLKGLCETQSRLVDMGLIEVKGGEIVK